MFDKELFLQQAIEIALMDLEKIRSCLVLAPHPDDESLGCGGLIAMLADRKVEVSVIVTTDGSQSHPNSKAFPPEKVKSMRKKEVIKALEILGLRHNSVMFLKGKDTSLPARNQDGFQLMSQKLSEIIQQLKPQLILVPYKLDPHCDHRATWQLLDEALKDYSEAIVWEYPIWLYELAEDQDIPTLKPGELRKINIEEFLNTKIRAIKSHLSQTTKMINDDPTGFILTDEVIAHFTAKFEYYIERR